MSKETVYVQGMSCSACELNIEKELLNIPGVTFVEALLSQGVVRFEYTGKKPTITDLNNIFQKMGYTFSKIPPKKSKKSLLVVMLTSISIIGVFLLISQSSFATLINVSSQSSLPTFFVFGLIAGLSTCATLIGGLVLSLSKLWDKNLPENSSIFYKIYPHFLFNFGRLVSFSLLGLILGLFGSTFSFLPLLTSILLFIVSIFMLIIGLQMLGINLFNSLKLSIPKHFSKFLFQSEKSQKLNSFIIGFLTFLIPCGFTIAVQGLSILSQNPLRGFLIMLFFALGTSVPLLFIGFASTKVLGNQKWTDTFSKVAGVLVIFFVLYNLNLQLGLPSFGNSNQEVSQNSEILLSKIASNQSPQIIKSVYKDASDIKPNTFEVKVGVPVRFEVKVEANGYGCMSTIMIPGLWDKPLTLKKDQTLIMDFTPNKVGEYPITCAMGAPRGSLKVVD